MKRIKHNDLTHYFLRPHQELPQAYLASCEKFFKNLSVKQRAASIDKKFKSFKQQASSTKRQASSLTDTDSGTIKDLESRKL